MNAMLSEIMEMPAMAKNFVESSPEYILPNGVPYLGMGSSYFAPLAFKFMGVDIKPEPASEFYNYLKPGNKLQTGVLHSQSGRSTEVLWCAELFEKYVALSNYADSALCTHPAVEEIVLISAGEEKYSSSKTYLNTLLALFRGFGTDSRNAVDLLTEKFSAYEQKGKESAEEILLHCNKNHSWDIRYRKRTKYCHRYAGGPGAQRKL